MAIPIKMPKMGLSGDTSLIGQWLKKKGDRVSLGEPILTIETDKATFDVEAETEGILLETFYKEGDEVPVFEQIGLIGEEGEDFTEFLNVPTSIPSEDCKKKQSGHSLFQDDVTVTNENSKTKNSTKISPRAKRLAEKLNLDYSLAIPSGPEGRIIEKDILGLLEHTSRYTSTAKAAISSGNGLGPDVSTGLGGRITLKDTISSEVQHHSVKLKTMESDKTYTVNPLSRIRNIIANNMMNSLQNTAQLTLHTTFDATAILEYRNRVKKHKNELELANISLNDMILFAVSRTLVNHKELNAHLVERDLYIFDSVHLGMAVDTQKGLIVPTLFNANLKSLMELTKLSKEMIRKCKDETINPSEIQGASFTVTNLGVFGIESFTPVLNPPQVGILGVNKIVHRIKEENGTTITYPSMGLSLTFDHRALDGAPAAMFLQELTNHLEKFDLLLAK